MSACEVVNLSGFVSSLNRMRVEMSEQSLDGFTVGQWVTNTTNGRKCRLERFCRSEGIYKADVRYWRENPQSVCRKHLFMVGLFELEPTETCNGLRYVRKLDSIPRKGL